ncbi:MAG: DUF2141 domain-containing protein [Pseudomonadota bacterium]
MRSLLGIGALFVAASAAQADSVPREPNSFAKYADPSSVVAAVNTEFAAMAGQSVRLSVYDSKDAFLEVARIKHQGKINKDGVAIVTFRGLAPGEYAFAAYLDKNDDGVLNRGKVLGIPKEPVAFSNGVVPKLRKPSYEETKVAVAPGSVVVITLEE